MRNRIWRDYSLTIVIGAVFIAVTIVFVAFGWWQYVAEQTSRNQDPTVWGARGYVVYLGEWTFQNWQSEFLIVLFMIVASRYLIHRGSHESRDTQDEMAARIHQIWRRVDALERPGAEDG